MFYSIYKKKKWKEWEGNFKKSDPPPDFFSNKMQLMMEVMRIDDHAHYNEDGVLVNPVNQRESMIQKQVREKFKEKYPNIDLSNVDVFVNAVSGLPSIEDHNYGFYYENFKRVLEKHIKNIPLYRNNHPDKELIFFVFDESTAYVVVDDENFVKQGPIPLKWFTAQPLWHFYDKKFLDVFKETDIDYLIWCTPFKFFHGESIVNQPPKVCVFDVRNHNYSENAEYEEKFIVSSEA